MTVLLEAEPRTVAQTARPELVEGLPCGWSIVSISDISTSHGGGTPSKSDSSFWTNGNVPWVSPKDMKSFHIVASEDRVSEGALKRLSLIPANSVLIVVRSGILSHTLPVGVNSLPVTINQDMRAFVPAQEVSARFLAWQLIAMGREILTACSKDGTTVASIEAPALARFPLMLAPAAEQTRIVEKLEELLSDLDAGVAELKAAQKKLVQYRQSLLKAAVEGALTAEWRRQRRSPDARIRVPVTNDRNPIQSADGGLRNPDASIRATEDETGAQLLARILKERRARWEAKQLAKFAEQGKGPPKGWQDKYPDPVKPDTTDLPTLPEGWVWASLDMLGEIVSGVAKGTKRDERIAVREVPYLRVANVQRGYLDLSEVKTIHATERDIGELTLRDGDVLFNEGGDRDKLGRGWVWRNEVDGCIHQNHVFRMRPFLAETVPELVSHHGNGFGKLWFQSAGKQTTNLASINMGMLRAFPVPVAPAAEQLEILLQLELQADLLDRQVKTVDHALKQSTAQRKNILKAAFSGKLVPQDPNDEPASALLARIRTERDAHVGTPRARGRRKIIT